MNVRLHRILWLSLWLAFAVTPDGLHAALTPEKLYKKLLPSVMTLEVETESGERFIGSAVLAVRDDAALTAWHVVADARSVWAVFADGQRVKVIGCIDYDGLRDLALLKLEKRLPHRQAALCPSPQSVAARAYVIGAPKGFDFSISDGLISQIRSVDGFLQYQLSWKQRKPGPQPSRRSHRHCLLDEGRCAERELRHSHSGDHPAQPFQATGDLGATDGHRPPRPARPVDRTTLCHRRRERRTD